jgi:hypothetical protein
MIYTYSHNTYLNGLKNYMHSISQYLSQSPVIIYIYAVSHISNIKALLYYIHSLSQYLSLTLL